MNQTVTRLQQQLFKAEHGTMIWSVPLAGGGHAVVKLYRRRGIFDPLRRLFVPYRTEREYRLLRWLRSQGVACPEPIAWSQGRDRPHGRFERLEMREVEAAASLAHWLASPRAPGLATLFSLIRRMHLVGVVHGALYVRNVLVAMDSGSDPIFYLIDLAHGRTFGRDIAGTRPADFDLLDLLDSISRQQPLDCAGDWLAAYGFDAGAAQRLLDRLPGHRGSRLRRKLRRIETDAHAMLARLSWGLRGRRCPG